MARAVGSSIVLSAHSLSPVGSASRNVDFNGDETFDELKMYHSISHGECSIDLRKF